LVRSEGGGTRGVAMSQKLAEKIAAAEKKYAAADAAAEARRKKSKAES
jgi:hypothetical protein